MVWLFRKRSLHEKSKNGKLGMLFGGNIWESNPSGTGLAPHTGFEDQEAHRHLSAPSESIAEIGSFVNPKRGQKPFFDSLLTKRGQIK